MNRHLRHRVIALAILMVSFCGCALLPRQASTETGIVLPSHWQQSAVEVSEAAGGPWWTAFNDPQLTGLIEKALAVNNDLAAAAVKVRRAQLQAGLAQADLSPTVTVGGSHSDSRNLSTGSTARSYGLTGTVSYELDLWGRVAAARDSARWEAEATEQDRRSATLSLAATVANLYWQAAWLNQRITSTEASIANGETTLSLVQVKYEAGAVSGLDLAQARASLASLRATLSQLQQQRTETRNALAILFDQSPENTVPELQQLPSTSLPQISAGLPASVLGRRPDLQAAEYRLREYRADIDSTRASYYPAISLTGSLGGSSVALRDILQNPVGTLGVGLTLPFLQWNSATLSIAVAESSYEEAVVSFRQSLYTALAEVENALSARKQYETEGLQLEQALAAETKAEELAEYRYRAGATGVQSWLDEQERRRDAETALAENQLNRLKATVALFQALGGDTAPDSR